MTKIYRKLLVTVASSASTCFTYLASHPDRPLTSYEYSLPPSGRSRQVPNLRSLWRRFAMSMGATRSAHRPSVCRPSSNRLKISSRFPDGRSATSSLLMLERAGSRRWAGRQLGLIPLTITKDFRPDFMTLAGFNKLKPSSEKQLP